jgi:hypothetical protein
MRQTVIQKMAEENIPSFSRFNLEKAKETLGIRSIFHNCNGEKYWLWELANGKNLPTPVTRS